MRHLRIATFNLENLDDRMSADGICFADRLAVLQPQIQRMRADILCLQEVNARTLTKHGPRRLTALEALLDNTDYSHFQQVCSTSRTGVRAADHHNLVILSRHPIRAHRQVWHHLVPPPQHHGLNGTKQGVEWDRPLLLADIDLPNGHLLTIINVHLRAPRAAWVDQQKQPGGVWRSIGGWAEGFYLASQKQTGQALELRLTCEQIFDGNPAALLAVCGDFNASDREAPLRIIRGDEEDTGNGHLAARTLVPVDRGLAADRRYSVIHHGRPVMLDHILVSRPLLGALRGVEVHNETLGDELTGPLGIAAPPDSYHAPLVAEFSCP